MSVETPDLDTFQAIDPDKLKGELPELKEYTYGFFSQQEQIPI